MLLLLLAGGVEVNFEPACIEATSELLYNATPETDLLINAEAEVECCE